MEDGDDNSDASRMFTGARWVTFAWRLALWMLRVYQRGPIACGIDATPVLNWESGCVCTAGSGIDHVISVVGSVLDRAQVGKTVDFSRGLKKAWRCRESGLGPR